MIWLFIAGAILIAWIVPRPVMRRLPSRGGVVLAVLLALLLGALFIWLGAAAAERLGFGDAAETFEKGLNAWKIMLLLAPASALYHRGERMRRGDGQG